MASRIQEILEDLQNCKVMVIGDVLLDHYAFGKVSRVSPEVPIQVLDVDKEEYRLGGAANVAHNMAALGAKVMLVGVIGHDVNGEKLCRILEENGINGAGIIPSNDRPTTLKTRLISQGQHLLRTDREQKNDISQKTSKQILHFIESHIYKQDALVISDYAKGVLTEELCCKIVEMANRCGKKIFVGPKGLSWERYRGATLISANRVETEMVTGIKINEQEDTQKAAKILLDKLQLGVIVITLGAKGMYLCSQQGDSFQIKAEAREVFDVAGAGDTVLSLFSLVAGKGHSWKNAARLANAAAGLVVAKVGTSIVNSRELENKFSQGQISHLSKIKQISELLMRLEYERSLGRAIVFTNGCFDLLHPGHVRYLEYCKSRGDILVVGLNSDCSVRAIKGDSRPIIGQNDRAEMLSSLSCTDYVVVFDESTPAEIIGKVRPDVLIKGSDWTAKGIVGREIVENNGGVVEFYDLVQGYSSTTIIERILKTNRKEEAN